MAHKTTYQIQRNRRRSGQTSYKKRYNALKSDKPRLVARVLSKMIAVEIMKYKTEGDITLVGTNSLELKKFGWAPKRNIPTAYLTGLLIGRKALKKGIKEAIFDIGLQRATSGGRVFAILKGAIDAGMDIPYKEKALPKTDRIEGKHIESFRKVKLNFSEVKAKVNNQ